MCQEARIITYFNKAYSKTGMTPRWAKAARLVHGSRFDTATLVNAAPAGWREESGYPTSTN